MRSNLLPEIGSLTALRNLYVRNNQLTTLPPEIGSLGSLQTLDVCGNQLAALPPELRRLKELRRLSLHGKPDERRELPTIVLTKKLPE